jgi:alkylation response protein AidB-like acyl-CoA dehydrogenase
MNFDRSEEQQLLAESVRRFVARDYAFETRRRIVDSEAGVSDEAWTALAQLGVLGLALPTDHGGFGGGAVDLMGPLEAFGDALIVEPWIATVALGARLIARGGSDAQKQEILPRVCDGALKLAFAQTERSSRYRLSHVATRAEKTSTGYRLSGEKRVVLHAASADRIVVSARTRGGDADEDGVSLFLVDRNAPGLRLAPTRTFDSMRAADMRLDGVQVSTDARIGTEHAALPLIEEAVDFATALVCAEAVGALDYANQATLEYLKTRKQFGAAIGSFQALQHRMVDMKIAAEQARSMASLACSTVDGARDARMRSHVVSAAKLKVSQVCRRVGQEAIQLHGGMGMSDEVKVSHTFRRLTAIARQFGDADYHLERFARTA